mmetsp:Transcript_6832/g.20161  ORF Transcript_6832/g.20161 Transcript_6832/m.20161 type:complete len:287 (-) Transcript_6832:411-1271(-)
MGGDGDYGSSGGGKNVEKEASALLNERPSLDSSWSFQAQFSALKASNPQDDLSFRENSVRDVTDRGRAEGASKLQAVLDEALRSRPTAAPRKAAPALPPSTAANAQENEVRREVRAQLDALQRLRPEPPTKARDGAVLQVLRKLAGLKISVACLKSTKVAAELNQSSWRGNEVAPEVRGLVTALIKDWRAMYRAEEGTSTLTPEARTRKCRNLSMDLEECAYGRYQRVAQYIQTIEGMCCVIKIDSEVSSNLLAGTLPAKELVDRVSANIRRQAEKRKREVQAVQA